MNNGTRVYAKGTIVSMDGKTTIQLQDRQTVTLPGAALAPAKAHVVPNDPQK